MSKCRCWLTELEAAKASFLLRQTWDLDKQRKHTRTVFNIGLGMCKVRTEAAQHERYHRIAQHFQHFEHEHYHRFRHVSSWYRNSPLRSTWNTNIITGLGMCQLCTEAVHCVALGTRTLSQLFACVKYVPKQSIA